MKTLYKSTTKNHFEKFETLLAGNKRELAKAAKELGTKEEFTKLFEKDTLLRNFPTHKYNKYFVLDRKTHTLAENISLVKHYIIFHYLEVKPLFSDAASVTMPNDEQPSS